MGREGTKTRGGVTPSPMAFTETQSSVHLEYHAQYVVGFGDDGGDLLLGSLERYCVRGEGVHIELALGDESHAELQVRPSGPSHEDWRIGASALPDLIVVPGARSGRPADIDVPQGGGQVERGPADDHDLTHLMPVGGEFHTSGEFFDCLGPVAAEGDNGRVESTPSGELAAQLHLIFRTRQGGRIDAPGGGYLVPALDNIPAYDVVPSQLVEARSKLSKQAESHHAAVLSESSVAPPQGMKRRGREHRVGSLVERHGFREGHAQVVGDQRVVRMPGVSCTDGRDTISGSELLDAVARFPHHARVGVPEGSRSAFGVAAPSVLGEPTPIAQLGAWADQRALDLQKHTSGGRRGNVLLDEPNPPVGHYCCYC